MSRVEELPPPAREPGGEEGELLCLLRFLLPDLDEIAYLVRTDPAEPVRGKPLFISQGLTTLLGWAPEELLAGPALWFSLVHPDDAAPLLAQTQEMFARGCGGTRQYRLRHKTTGEYRWLEDRVSLKEDPARGGIVLFGLARDITARRLAEQSLSKLSRVVEQSDDHVLITDAAGVIEYVNPAFERQTGWSLAEARGKTPRILKSGHHDVDFYRRMWCTILTGRPFRAELLNRKKGGDLYYEDTTITPLVDGGGRIGHFVSTARDITEKKRLETQFLRSQRLESIGRLASGIAHDLNNVLSPILMAAELLRHPMTPVELAQLAQTIQSSAERGAALVQQLTSFGRGAGGARTPARLPALLRDLGKLMCETFPKKLTFEVSAPADLWPVLGDATQLYQVLLNLCVNARDAMPEGGTLAVSAANLRLDEAAAAAILDAKPGAYVCLRVSDTGMGIAPELLDHIFEPFFTTKEPGKGTGLGLATVASIVRGHGGVVRVHSKVGNGTVFEVLLCAVPEAAPPTAPVVRAAPPNGHQELILVVDDEASFRELAQRMLQAASYRVLVAESAAAALALYAEHRGEVRLVLVDYQMPGMDGVELARALRGLNDAVSLIVASGLVPEEALAEFRDLGVRRFVAKPFPADELLAAVHEELSGQRSRPT